MDRKAKLRRDAHRKGAANLLAWWEKGTKPSEKSDDVATGGDEGADDLASLGDSLCSIFFRRFCHLDICARH